MRIEGINNKNIIRKSAQENEAVLTEFSETALPGVPSVQFVTILQKNSQYWYSVWLHNGFTNEPFDYTDKILREAESRDSIIALVTLAVL